MQRQHADAVLRGEARGQREVGGRADLDAFVGFELLAQDAVAVDPARATLQERAVAHLLHARRLDRLHLAVEVFVARVGGDLLLHRPQVAGLVDGAEAAAHVQRPRRQVVLARRRHGAEVVELAALGGEERGVLTEHAEARRQPHDLVAQFAQPRIGERIGAGPPERAAEVAAALPQFVDQTRGAVWPQMLLLGALFAAQTVVIFGSLGWFAGAMLRWLYFSKMERPCQPRNHKSLGKSQRKSALI